MSNSIIAVVNQKGGTGKTTTSVNLSSALSSKGKSVMIIDLDPQGNLSYSLGLTQFENTIAEVLLGELALSDIMLSAEGMKIAPSNIDLADVELTIAQAKSREQILSNILSGIKGYDYIIIDCPPSLSLLTINALNAANKVIIPMQMEVLSLQGLDQIIATIEKINQAFKKEIEILGILPVMVDSRKKLSTEIHHYISQNYIHHIFQSQIKTNVRASEAPSFGQSVIKYAPSSRSSKDYLSLADEVINLLKK
jgi:chromosome partitioning protein